MSALGRVIWYPFPTALTVRVTDLGLRWTDVQETEWRNEFVLDNAYGCRTRIVYGARRMVDIRCELIGTASVARELEALVNHVRSHAPIAMAENDDCYIGGKIVPPAALATSIQLLTNPWTEFGAGSSFASGDVFVIKSGGPNYLREEVVVTAKSQNSLTLQSGLIYDYTDEPFVWIHQKPFHPFLRLRAEAGNRQLLRHDRRITWSLDLPMEEVPITEDALSVTYAGPS